MNVRAKGINVDSLTVDKSMAIRAIKYLVTALNTSEEVKYTDPMYLSIEAVEDVAGEGAHGDADLAVLFLDDGRQDYYIKFNDECRTDQDADSCLVTIQTVDDLIELLKSIISDVQHIYRIRQLQKAR